MNTTLPRLTRDPSAARHREVALSRQLAAARESYERGQVFDPMEYLRLVHAYCRAANDAQVA